MFNFLKPDFLGPGLFLCTATVNSRKQLEVEIEVLKGFIKSFPLHAQALCYFVRMVGIPLRLLEGRGGAIHHLSLRLTLHWILHNFWHYFPYDIVLLSEYLVE